MCNLFAAMQNLRSRECSDKILRHRNFFYGRPYTRFAWRPVARDAFTRDRIDIVSLWRGSGPHTFSWHDTDARLPRSKSLPKSDSNTHRAKAFHAHKNALDAMHGTDK